jgi:hypothetical protein
MADEQKHKVTVVVARENHGGTWALGRRFDNGATELEVTDKELAALLERASRKEMGMTVMRMGEGTLLSAPAPAQAAAEELPKYEEDTHALATPAEPKTEKLPERHTYGKSKR